MNDDEFNNDNRSMPTFPIFFRRINRLRVHGIDWRWWRQQSPPRSSSIREDSVDFRIKTPLLSLGPSSDSDHEQVASSVRPLSSSSTPTTVSPHRGRWEMPQQQYNDNNHDTTISPSPSTSWMSSSSTSWMSSSLSSLSVPVGTGTTAAIVEGMVY
jgi:hypothetical protein